MCVWDVRSDNHQISPSFLEAKQISGYSCHLHVGCMQAALPHRPEKDLRENKRQCNIPR